MSQPATRPNYFIFSALLLFILAVYVRTLCPTVYWEDAGELITVSHVLGIAHPPGHPLYSIIGHLFTLIPLGTIAARVNFLSALFGALAAALVYPCVLHLVREGNDNPAICHCAGAMASLFAAFGTTVWDQSVVAETSTLHAFFFMTLVLIFLSMERTSDDALFSRKLFFFSFVYGLSLTNHVAGVFLIPAFALWALVRIRARLLSFRKISVSIVFFLAGLSVYLYLPIRSSQNPVIDWGNPETLSNFWWVVSAGQFQGNVFSVPSAAEMMRITFQRIAGIQADFTNVGVCFVLLGIWAAFRQRKDFLLFAAVVIGTLFAVTLNPSFISAYFIPALLLLAAFLGLGADSLANIILGFGQASMRRVVVAAVCCVIMVSPVLPLVRHYPLNDRSHYYLARDYGMRILDALPPRTAFFTIDLNAIFTMWYLMYCEGMRKDVLVIEPTWLTNSDSMRQEIFERYPELLMPEPGKKVVTGRRLGQTSLYDKDFLLAIFKKNAEIRPIFLGAVPFVPTLKPRGLVYQFAGSGQDLLDNETILHNREFWEAVEEQFRHTPELAHDRVASLIYPENLRHQGQWFREAGNDKQARWAFELACSINPKYAPAWLQLGELCRSEGEYEKALKCLARAAELDPQVRPCARFIRGQILYAMGEYGRAVSEFAEVTREKPNYPEAHNTLGSLYLRTGNPDEAEHEFREEIKVNPKTEGAYSNLAQILLQRNNLDEAEKLLNAGVKANGNVWQNFYFLAMVNALRGKREEATRLVGTAASLGGARVFDMAANEAVLQKIVTIPPQKEGER